MRKNLTIVYNEYPFMSHIHVVLPCDEEFDYGIVYWFYPNRIEINYLMLYIKRKDQHKQGILMKEEIIKK